MGMQTPMAKIVRRGSSIFTVDTTGRETLAARAPDPDRARWVLAGLRSFHAGTEVEEEDPRDAYAEQVADAGNRRMREVSGRVDDFRPLVALLYELGRDLVPLGVLEERLERIAGLGRPDEDGERGPVMFTNGWLARWAQDAAERLDEPVDVDHLPIPPAVRSLLAALDGHLGLAIHRGEGPSDRWKDEADALVLKIREVLR